MSTVASHGRKLPPVLPALAGHSAVAVILVVYEVTVAVGQLFQIAVPVVGVIVGCQHMTARITLPMINSVQKHRLSCSYALQQSSIGSTFGSKPATFL